METFELRYFLGVATTQNIHKASEKLNISVGSLSKAVSRLEEELGVKLFHREGRNIKITDHGRLLQKRASEIVHLEESAKVEIAGHRGLVHVIIAGPEILLSRFATKMARDLKKRHTFSTFEYHAVNDQKAMAEVLKGEAHIAIVTTGSSHSRLQSKPLEEVTFQTYVAAGHPLYEFARNKKTINVEEVLTHPFVSPSHSILGAVGAKQSLDGWRDDKFPRKVQHLVSSLKLLEELVIGGDALAYLPDYYAASLKLLPLKISGCPYSCAQKIKMVIRNPNAVGWLNQIF